MDTIDSAARDLVSRTDIAETDAERANLRHAQRAVATLAQWAGGGPWGSQRDMAEPLEYNLRDMLSDVMHLARAADIDFDDVVIWAGNRFLEECEEELIAWP